VLREVAAVAALGETRRAQLVDALCIDAAERRNGLRNKFIASIIRLGAAALARLAGLPPWLGFVAGLLIALALARSPATRALRRRLAQWLDPPTR
jgi:hypothetical protein